MFYFLSTFPFFTSILLSSYLSHNFAHRGTLHKYLSRLVFILTLIYFAVFNHFSFFVITQIRRNTWNMRGERKGLQCNTAPLPHNFFYQESLTQHFCDCVRRVNTFGMRTSSPLWLKISPPYGSPKV